MSTSSDNDSPQSSPGGSSEDTTTNVVSTESPGGSSKDTTTLREKNEHLKKELADKEDLIRTQTAKLEKAEKHKDRLLAVIEESKSKVSELEKELQKLRLQVSPTSPSNQGRGETPAKSPPSSIQSQSNVPRRQLYSDSEERQDGNAGDSEPMTAVPRKLELMVEQVTHITEEVTKLKKDNEQLKKDNEQLNNDFELAYSPLFNKKGKVVYEYIKAVRALKWTEKVSEDVEVSKYICYYDPTSPDQDKCVKGHPLRDIAQRCARISTSWDPGHIYVALLNVDGQYKHYVGKADNWRERWQTNSTSHEKQIKKAVEYLPKLESSMVMLHKLQRCDIEMGFAILKFKQNNQHDQRIVVYKMQCSLSKTDKKPSGRYLEPHEQHFMNVFSDLEFKNTETLNDNNAMKSHSCGSCPFSRGSKTCKSFLEKVLKFIEEDWQQNLTHSRCIPPAVHPGEPLRHPLTDIVQGVVRASERDSNSTGARVHIALINAMEFKHYIEVTERNGNIIDEMRCLLLQGDAGRCKIFNYMCTDKRSAIKRLTAIFKAAAEGSENPQVCLYTIAAKEVTPVAKEMESVQQHFINALEGWMVGGTSTLVNPLQGGDSIHSGDVCAFSSNVKLECSVHLHVTTFPLQANPICSLKFIKDNNKYDCVYDVLTHQSPNHEIWLQYSQQNGYTTTPI